MGRNKYEQFRDRQRVNFFVTLFLIALLCIAIGVTSRNLSRGTQNNCFRDLSESTVQIADLLKDQVESDSHEIQTLSKIISYNWDNKENVVNTLSSIYSEGSMTQGAILLPGDKVLTYTGDIIDAQGLLSFDKIAAKGMFISGKEPSLLDKDKSILRNYCPVIKNHQIIGILYGISDVEHLKSIQKVTAFNGSAEMHIIEGGSGKVIFSTGTNHYDSVNQIFGTKSANASNSKSALKNISQGRGGNVLKYFGKSKIYMHYEPVHVNDWFVILSVSDKVAFARLEDVRNTMWDLVVFSFAVIGIYLIWILLSSRHDRSAYRVQFDQINYMSRVEKILFDAHRNESHMVKALEEVGKTVKAKHAFILILDKSKIIQHTMWSKDKGSFDFNLTGIDISITVPKWYKQCSKSSQPEIFNIRMYPENSSEYNFMRNMKISNMLVMSIFDAENNLTGILGVADLSYPREKFDLLGCVALSFSSAMMNKNAHDRIEEMGSIDLTTGLLNRNRYLRFVDEFDPSDVSSMMCIYIDVNGLHEMNNEKGHEEGDIMLAEIGLFIQKNFPDSPSFRIGGDEFLIIQTNVDFNTSLADIEDMKKDLAKNNCYISVGTDFRTDNFNIPESVRIADRNMYKDKSHFYQDHDRRKR